MRRALVTLAVLLGAPVLLCGQEMAVEYYHLDAQGNVLAVTDENANLVEWHDYDVFGREVDGQVLGQPQPRRFTGKERDPETGWDYFGARYYGSNVGRFTTVDPVYTWQENLANPQLWNRYAYARNNPLRYVDPDGRASMLTGDSMRAMAANMEANNAALGKVLVNTIRAINSPGHMSAEKSRAYYEQPDSPDQALRMDVADLLVTTGLAATLVRGNPGAASGNWASLSGMLRAAARGKGNFGVGSATAEEAAAMGNAWVGEGATLASDAKTLVSASGLRQYRPPSYKPNLGRVQANLESRPEAKGPWQSNAHVDIVDKK